MAPALTRPTAIRGLGFLLLVGLAVLAAHAATSGPDGADPLYDAWLYDALIVGAAMACLLRGVLVKEERAAWLVMAAGMFSWAAGEIYWSLVLSEMDEPPYPSIADALYIAYYPASYVTLMLLVRSRVTGVSRAMWLDGAIGALAVAALAAAAVFQPIVDATSGNTAAVATNLAYPIGDLLLLGLVMAVFGLCSWRPGRAFLLIGLALSVSALADVIYLFQSAKGTYVEGGMLDVMWPLAALLVAAAAWQPVGKRTGKMTGLRVIVVPVACSMVALGLIAYHNLDRLNEAATVLGLATLMAVTVRMAMAFRENQRMLEHSRTEALTDALTGLANRRKLMIDLEREVELADAADPRALILFDLDGFKQYNDSYGHPAGDALLARLGRRLGDAAQPYGYAYRLGGDEFCALVRPGSAGLDVAVSATAAALSEAGEGFSVTSSHGEVLIPHETQASSEALQLADRRMYAQKGGKRSSAGRQTRDVLLSTLRERQPELHIHLHDVAELALAVGRHLGLDAERLDEIARAAELHDVGKIAIPDAILNKPGPLDDDEWAFMRRHTIIGERILGAAPALRPVARIVRSSHERWDGDGYPDRLAGEDIPLGSRIVAVCDAYDAMTSERPYRESLMPAEAIQELERCSGTQFDPAVVEIFSEVLASTRTTAG
jgi:two-component system, cell cycle response regulator